MMTFMSFILPSKTWVYLITGMSVFASHCRVTPLPSKPVSTDSAITAESSLTTSGAKTTTASTVPLKNMFGINSYEWDFLQNPADPNNRTTIYETNMALIKSFSAVRHYMNWNKLENTEGNYTYDPTNDGSWDYDLIYTRCKQEGITVLADLKNCPRWMLASYPADQQDDENAPLPYGADMSKPASYLAMAKVGFQFAARYGSNAAVDKSLVTVDSRPRWTNDRINVVKIGLNLVKYIECNNEPDRWWKGPQTTQTPEQYAANLSAFYDGDKGKLGKNAGVKTADPNMMVVMGGIATCDPNYVARIIAWCKTNRGTRADGSVDLCFDVVNYHYYSNNGSVITHRTASTGVAPELSDAGTIADSFTKVAYQYHLPVWVTEAGYDINQGSYQKAIPIGTKSALITQADWILRTSLLYMRHHIASVYFYQLFDANPGYAGQYSTSGLAENGQRRPAADYILQTTKLMGTYTYVKTISTNPLVDQYQNGKKTMYVLTVPDQVGRTAAYTLDLGKTTLTANIYNPKVGADAMTKTTKVTLAGKVNVTVTETPMFIESAQ
ncbi:hypothetical protein C8P68_104269 [Mucilaginibacter yixingensis]|uniref:Spondin domain-containing protein n=1 Tax=Mucilaginibacter yixingensis TaxID=1295612 RepID=A0A2T5J9M7_9SPHI|nr:hypothetical protein C8P68_104269 [Mucilaginibacter yixingensis]